jgi:hypothetical protein
MGPVSEIPQGGGSGHPPESLRVVIVDDHEVLRAGTRQILETAPDIVVVG